MPAAPSPRRRCAAARHRSCLRRRSRDLMRRGARRWPARSRTPGERCSGRRAAPGSGRRRTSFGCRTLRTPARRSSSPPWGSISSGSPGQRHRHRVDREVPAREIALERRRLDLRQRPRLRIALRPGRGQVDPEPVQIQRSRWRSARERQSRRRGGARAPARRPRPPRRGRDGRCPAAGRGRLHRPGTRAPLPGLRAAMRRRAAAAMRSASRAGSILESSACIQGWRGTACLP